MNEDPMEALVESALLEFEWSDFGFDEVQEAQGRDWAAALAVDVVAKIRAANVVVSS